MSGSPAPTGLRTMVARAASLAFALALACPAAQAQGAGAGIAGLWLIEPDRYDALVEGGHDIPRYPVLVLGEDGRFAAYHLRFACEARDEAGRLAGQPGGPSEAEEAALCARQALASAADIGIGTALRIASGTFRRSAPPRLTFATEWRLAPDADLADLIRTVSAVPGGAKLARMLEAVWRPDFLEPGAAVDAERSGAVLTLRVAGADATVSYRRYDRAVLAGAADLVLALGVSGAQYFRCALAAVDAAFAKEGAARSETERALLALVATASELAAAERVAAAALLAPADRGRADAAAAQEPRRARLVAQLTGSPVFAALRDGGLGRALGCPARDNWPP